MCMNVLMGHETHATSSNWVTRSHKSMMSVRAKPRGRHRGFVRLQNILITPCIESKSVLGTTLTSLNTASMGPLLKIHRVRYAREGFFQPSKSLGLHWALHSRHPTHNTYRGTTEGQETYTEFSALLLQGAANFSQLPLDVLLDCCLYWLHCDCQLAMTKTVLVVRSDTCLITQIYVHVLFTTEEWH